MNDNEVYEYRAQVRQYIDALGKNPEEELPLVTIEEMRAWIDDFEESERERAKEEDGENYDSEGFKEQIYTIHIFDPIYPEEGKSPAQNAALMMQKNYELWKGCYEKTYGIPLTYLCDENKKDVE